MFIIDRSAITLFPVIRSSHQLPTLLELKKHSFIFYYLPALFISYFIIFLLFYFSSWQDRIEYRTAGFHNQINRCPRSRSFQVDLVRRIRCIRRHPRMAARDPRARLTQSPPWRLPVLTYQACSIILILIMRIITRRITCSLTVWARL
jgi:hypothetical protein